MPSSVTATSRCWHTASTFFLVVTTAALLSSHHAEAVKCRFGRGLNKKGQCELCPVGSYSPGGENVRCKKCADGWTTQAGSIADYQCQRCSGITAGRGGKCNRCPAGTYVNVWGAVRCNRKCNKLRGEGHLSENYVSCRFYVVCKPGMPSFIKECPYGSCWVNKKQCCVDSKDGKTCVEKLTDTCQPGYGVETDRCELCRYGYYNPPGNLSLKCKPCPAGTVPAELNDRTKCIPCGSTTYKAKPGGGYCLLCPAGTYSVQTSKFIGPAKCTPCAKRRLFKDVLQKCSNYVECKPGERPRKGTGCTSKQCFNERKQCCEDPRTKKCVKKLS